MDGAIAVGLLGPMEIRVRQHPVELSAGRLRALLAVLAMSAGRPVSFDALAVAVWGVQLPGNARRSVQTYVTRLRGVLGSAAISTRPGGYVLRVDPEDVDALRFLRLVDTAIGETRPERQRSLLGQALRLWRGTPFQGIPSAWLAEAEALRLQERYLLAVERRVDLDLTDGQGGDLVTELGELTARFPLRESLWVRLLVALDRCGRPAEALSRFETIRARLAEDLGVDPGPQLRQVHAELLAGRHPGPAGPAGRGEAGEPVPAAPDPPRQLPAFPPAFTGREEHLDQLDALLPQAVGHRRAATVVVTVHGPAGVGKTALAVRWAHRVRDRFPDGQLYVNLRGYDRAGLAITPGEALRSFLEALGIAQHRIPVDLPSQAALFRSVLAGKRVLVVLDNARDAEQARPLLPAGPLCMVVVTSRNQLAGLATAGARPLGLGLLGTTDANALLAHRLGRRRVASQPAAVAAIIERCAGLPLALAIVAGRADTHQGFPLAALADQLADSARGLDAFAADDPATDIRAVFSWSYRTLRPDAARLLRLLGMHAGSEIAAPAAASLAGIPPARAASLLAELARIHLLGEHTPGRFTVHDLVRAYAVELAEAHDSAADREAAWHRILDHYLHTGHTASRLLDPYEESIALQPAQPGVTPQPLTQPGQALAWFATECPALLATQARACTTGRGSYALDLAAVMWAFFRRQGRWHDLVAIERAALLAARDLIGRPSQAAVHRALGRVYGELCRYDDAHRELRRALTESDSAGDEPGLAATHRLWAWLCQQRGDYAEALVNSRRALELSRRAGDEIGQAKALSQIGWCRSHLGDYPQALECGLAALEVQTRLGDLFGQGVTWRGLGYAHHRLRDQEQAIACYRRGLQAHRQSGDRHARAETLAHLGDAYHARGDPASARSAWQEGLAILGELGHPDARRVLGRERKAG